VKVVIVGGSGLIGAKLAKNLHELGSEVIAASRRSGANAMTGEGLPEALAGAQVVVDVMNSPSWEDAAGLRFFETSTRNLLAAGAKAGVRHHVALSGPPDSTTAGPGARKVAHTRQRCSARTDGLRRLAWSVRPWPGGPCPTWR
jgi:uncharacterized protein YbjT (DUF2867 family)